MFLEKDKLSRFEFVSIIEFSLILFLIFISTLFSFLFLPLILKRFLPAYSAFFNSQYFGIVLFFLSGILMIYIFYYFCCKKKNKTFSEGMFLNPVSLKTGAMCLLIGLIMPLISLPVIFKFAPHEFYAMDLAKTKEGLIYLFACALFAPVFEEFFYRGFIFPFFQSKLNSFWAVIITSLFFGLSHYMNIGNAYILLSMFIVYGFVLTLIRYFTSSLIPPVITHLIHNAVLMSCFIIFGNK
ncbi:MAG: hypothetical protein A3B68_04775 [Candidatus Melainabacteria bacterium RIFCSPHIGHO2_02_FULL_34_12]|nr:MAG: hypothetical protein A3B68_04775 [Candidatus Melainabacteria bacterium RIFCSPHIGHO2_02_FULL_34_12]